MAGAKSVQINNMGYRTMETIWTPAEPGQNVVLTINWKLQQATEHGAAHVRPGHARRGGRDGRAQRRHPRPGFRPEL